jgi:hypothetical protein
MAKIYRVVLRAYNEHGFVFISHVTLQSSVVILGTTSSNIQKTTLGLQRHLCVLARPQNKQQLLP